MDQSTQGPKQGDKLVKRGQDLLRVVLGLWLCCLVNECAQAGDGGGAGKRLHVVEKAVPVDKHDGVATGLVAGLDGVAEGAGVAGGLGGEIVGAALADKVQLSGEIVAPGDGVPELRAQLFARVPAVLEIGGTRVECLLQVGGFGAVAATGVVLDDAGDDQADGQADKQCPGRAEEHDFHDDLFAWLSSSPITVGNALGVLVALLIYTAYADWKAKRREADET